MLLFNIVSAVLGAALVAHGGPVAPPCSEFLWKAAGNHGPSSCTEIDENVLLKKLEYVKGYYSKKLFRLQNEDENIFNNPHFKEIIEDIGSLLKYKNDRSSIICTGCKAAIDLIRLYIDEGKPNEEIYGLIGELCTSFKVQTPSVCGGIAQIFGPEVVFIANITTVEPSDLCTALTKNDCGESNSPSWSIELPPPLSQEVPPPPPADGPVLKVLHIADTHFDRYYTEGAKVYCDEPLCCRAENGMATGDEKGAGKWGDWMCDTPEITFDSMLEHAAETHPDIDYIIWTGDLPSHDVWKQTQQDSLDVLDISVSKVFKYFPNVPVFPSVGNHESSPVNSFAIPAVEWSNSWLYDQMYEKWSRWLPADTENTIKSGGFYTAVARPGLRIVSLNTNYCLSENWWLTVNNTDPAQQLQWLVEVLKKAEDENEKVQILSHIPPGHNECITVWQYNYYKIVTRFENVISAQFFGHTHKDEIEIHYDVNNTTRPVSVGYIAPSVTTYTSLNPGYRVYYIDGDRQDTTRAVIDHENWVMNLEETNLSDEPKWYKSYSAKEEYGLESLSAENWNKFYEQLKTDDDLFKLYYQHYMKDSPERGNCDESCKRSHLCGIRSCRIYGEATL